MKAIFMIIIPSMRSKEVFILMLHTAFLILRTWLSVVVAKLDGKIVKDLVHGNGRQFLKGIGYWFAIAVPATYTNSMIRYLQSKLAIAFRTRLTRYVHDLYLSPKKTYYKLLNLDGRVDGPDQYITTDIARFCDSLSSLYSNIGKPLLDLFIFNYQLASSLGASGMIGLFFNYILSASILRAISPAFGKMAAEEAKLEGDFRSAHTRLITNAEEIAFYHGANLEKSILNRAYQHLIRHVNRVYKLRIGYNMFEDFVIKYCWSAIGLGVCSIPVFFPQWGGKGGRQELTGGSNASKDRSGARTQDFITNKRLMISLADAGGRIMYSYKELAELAGFTSRVYNLLSVLHSLNNNEYTSAVDEALLQEKIDEIYSLTDIRGHVEYGINGIQFKDVPIVTPNPTNVKGGELLVQNLNMDINKGDHLLITGPNGVGKTSVARVISGLWPVFRGTLEEPEPVDMFYIPQRPYLSLGTLREQVIYPHTYAQMLQDGRTDQELFEILKAVHLAYIPEREGGWETVKEWKDVFSGGEKQRMNMARLFYHHPKFAILDECTSAVSSDVEGLMYSHAKEMGITLITISHRPTLFKYHKYLLRLIGDHGRWEFSRIGTKEERMSVDNEVAELEKKLSEIEKLKKRVEEINGELQLSAQSGIHVGEAGGGGRLHKKANFSVGEE
ncbi:hypothetical protein K493DRAFT_265613 [Basidiobolus meristosporus CBS 931.73]|uniref:ABC transporter domain-containing protein n=1 Tax=Basidiobolus meristosporus CBS 931.73 TaxID=1314790 RepID=A0A1Y1XY37_9FUNG|nr:hypothetical protein K493DRAFT_265613 [Basidiobolus meristosporus CBS 931.73]|eukprot:ORX90565.1 hypothetical protein K493DRAFT_265613 [Basidiobolus meristosporus CBS 931.73]